MNTDQNHTQLTAKDHAMRFAFNAKTEIKEAGDKVMETALAEFERYSIRHYGANTHAEVIQGFDTIDFNRLPGSVCL